MLAKTKKGARLKHLADRYAKACVAKSWSGSEDDLDLRDKIDEDCERTRKNLHDAIDELTSVDLTPRSVSEGY